MKFIRKISLYFFLTVLFILFIGTSTYAAEEGAADNSIEEIYTVAQSEGKYCLYAGGGNGSDAELISENLYDVIIYIESQSMTSQINFVNVVCAHHITFRSGTRIIYGDIAFESGGAVTLDGGNVFFKDANVSFKGDGINIKNGKVCVEESTLTSMLEPTVKLEYSSLAAFEIKSGIVFSSSQRGTILQRQGSVCISGGEIICDNGPSIISSSSLILSKSPKIEGVDFDITTSFPITLKDENAPFSSSVRVKYESEFEKGKTYAVAYNASEQQENNFILYDKYGKKTAVKFYSESEFFSDPDVLSVYLPFEVRFHSLNGVVLQHKVYGERAEPLSLEIQEGYKFEGWRETSENGTFYEFDSTVSSDIDLYPSFKLLPPSFTFDSLTFTYDGESRTLCLKNLSHPLLSEGVISYKWFKDGEALSSYGDKINITNVSNSGKYKCLFTFSHNSYKVEVETGEVEVKVNKRNIPIPVITPAVYDGGVHYPDIYSISLYEVSKSGAVDAGKHPVKLTLNDGVNNAFEGTDSSEITIFFEILKGENIWLELPSAKDVFSGDTPTPSATSLFGKVRFVFSASSVGNFSSSVPREVGKYYFKAIVDGCENYSELISDPIPFCILQDDVDSIYIISLSDKKEYYAFDEFDKKGLEIGVKFLSGKETSVDSEAVSISYKKGHAFLYGDNCVTVRYMGKSVIHPVVVYKAEYDLSEIKFENTEIEYTGGYITHTFSGVLPVGKDGISLNAEVVGGASSVGEYTVTLRFFGESQNYVIPDEINAFLKITPKKITITWNDLEFVYDGSIKIPTAFYTDVNGKRVDLSVNGERSYAGKYTADALIVDKNYIAENAAVEFVIKKADYDLSGAYWTSSDYIYNGEEHAVILEGLPDGVSVIGYSDNKKTDAGVYRAFATLSYDQNNYNMPDIDSFNWEIKQASYDMSQISFPDKSFVYDGLLHYPEFVGEMPIGIDGSSPSYLFANGALDVGQEPTEIIIEFISSSKNYRAPEPMMAYVEMLPLGIEVKWENVELTYSGSLLAPKAYSDVCDITVSGAKKDAGYYTATAISLNNNYFVLNSTREFEILKADNSWKEIPGISSIYQSGSLNNSGSAEFGETVFIFSKNKVDTLDNSPSDPGVYYYKAICEGDNNHYSIESDWIEFEIYEVFAIGIRVELNKTEYLTLERVEENNVNAFIEYNDGKNEKIDFSNLVISYSDGDCFAFNDKLVTFSYYDYISRIDISVSKRDYDMSSVTWSQSEFFYDGTEKSMHLLGLPQGVTVERYIGNNNKNSGKYTVSAVVVFDDKNYNEPHIPDAQMEIKKCVLVLPESFVKEYSSEVLIPDLPDALKYDIDFEGAREVGVYQVSLNIKDTENYTFEDGGNNAVRSFKIVKRKLVIKINDIDYYLFEKEKEPSYSIIEGSLIEQEPLNFSYKFEEDAISADFQPSNYDIELIDGKITRYNKLSPEDSGRSFLLFLVFIVALLAILALILNRERLYKRFIKTVSDGDGFVPSAPVFEEEESHFENISTSNSAPSDVECEQLTIDDLIDVNGAETSEEENAVIGNETEGDNENAVCSDPINEIEVSQPVIDVGYADSAISDSLARDMIRREDEIETAGHRREVVNVDTLSRSFESGARIDVNILKRKSLIPYDTGYIKILARGIIDKPLDVYANDFSLPAVKMIVLAGGRCIRINTNSPKRRNNN